MKLFIHELEAARALVKADELEPAFKMLARIGQIQRMLFEQWSVLETLTPTEYLEFRDVLGPASGFQSAQYRALEYLLGNKDAGLLRITRGAPGSPDCCRGLSTSSSPLARRGLCSVAPEWLHALTTSPGRRGRLPDGYGSCRWWDGYEMARSWSTSRSDSSLAFRHMLTVQRIIGGKPGTGGSAGSPSCAGP